MVINQGMTEYKRRKTRRGLLSRAIMQSILVKRESNAREIFMDIAYNCPNANIPLIASTLSNLAKRGLITKVANQKGKYQITQKGMEYISKKTGHDSSE